MPELPEVETIRAGLQQKVVGLKITDVEVLFGKSFPYPGEDIDKYVIGAKIESLERRAKVLIINLSSDHSLLFHLKMTGQIVWAPKSGPRFAGGHPSESMARELPDNSTRAVFSLSDGSRIFFNDQRKFGWVKLVETQDVIRDSLIARLGPEPLTEAFELKPFAAILKRRGGSPIKAVILDQSTVSGVGNIYADESLHLAKIHPARLAGSLKPAEVKSLYEAIKTIIALGVEHGGTSFTHYVNALGGKGDYLRSARVFRRQGLTCPVCGTVIIKTRVAGRGTHLCPKCQKAPQAGVK
ncbi:MAG TPA: bifunctional DNA-formamidopyrimidine glycosylase/DNA-(apurinic or apyrimidinic site) lyase [Candidatus Saccharimonadales bacterium]|nr:bifunctional DNA-formamidopyrimidine glycosylase/DNA-(apurinic or apyrimidinic site) lyase [Candidatus Saccharimonadales bacterium]